MKAKRFLLTNVLVVMVLGLVCTSFTTDEKSRVVEEGGTGPYKAVMKEEAALVAHTVFVPQNLSSVNK